MNTVHKQLPGQSFTFTFKKTGETDAGILPVEYGQSNEFAIWVKDRKQIKTVGGHWLSRKFHYLVTAAWYTGTGPSGLLGRMKRLFSVAYRHCIERGQSPPHTFPEEMVKQWELQKGVCVACGESGLTLAKYGSAFDHNHDTGECRGFVHYYCNHAEGNLKDLSDEAFLHFVKWMRPHLFKEVK